MALSNVDNELFWASRNEDLNWNRDNHCGDVNFHQKVELKSYPFPQPHLITYKTLNLSAQTITMTMSQDYKDKCIKHWGDSTVSSVFAVASSAICCMLFPQLKTKFWQIFSPKFVTYRCVLYIKVSISKTIFLMMMKINILCKIMDLPFSQWAVCVPHFFRYSCWTHRTDTWEGQTRKYFLFWKAEWLWNIDKHGTKRKR